MKRIFSAAAMIAAGSILFASAALAQNATDNIVTSLTVQAECTVAAAPIPFGNIGIVSGNIDVQADLTVQCTAGSPYQVGLGAGAGIGATTGGRLLTNTVTPADTAQYQIYQNTGHTIPWGNTQGTDTVDVTAATGDPEAVTMYAEVPGPQHVAVGSYGDTVTATIWYGNQIAGE